MTTYSWTFICVISLCGVPSQSFTSQPIKTIPRFAPVRNIDGCLSPSHDRRAWVCHMTGDDENGGADWIKKSMGSEEDVSGGAPTPPEATGPPEFTQDEINDMDQLILSLSKESDDEKRRERLAGILDKELADASNNAIAEGDSDETDSGSEIPRFAELFQLSLDSIGERVQSAARKNALEQQKNLDSGDDTSDSKSASEGGDVVKRQKSQEELQLWALIDMMIQSKTRVKLHMGSLGSKGEFR